MDSSLKLTNQNKKENITNHENPKRAGVCVYSYFTAKINLFQIVHFKHSRETAIFTGVCQYILRVISISNNMRNIQKFKNVFS